MIDLSGQYSNIGDLVRQLGAGPDQLNDLQKTDKLVSNLGGVESPSLEDNATDDGSDPNSKIKKHGPLHGLALYLAHLMSSSPSGTGGGGGGMGGGSIGGGGGTGGGIGIGTGGGSGSSGGLA